MNRQKLRIAFLSPSNTDKWKCIAIRKNISDKKLVLKFQLSMIKFQNTSNYWRMKWTKLARKGAHLTASFEVQSRKTRTEDPSKSSISTTTSKSIRVICWRNLKNMKTLWTSTRNMSSWSSMDKPLQMGLNLPHSSGSMSQYISKSRSKSSV